MSNKAAIAAGHEREPRRPAGRPEGRRRALDGRELPLTSFELGVLVALARRAGEIVPREDLARAVKGGEYDPSVDRSLDVHVSHLRQKLGDDAREPKMIRTVRGVGYVLVRPA